jgi:hypothetical protein
MIILQALFGVQIKNKKMKFYITLILFLCCALSPSIVSGENDRHAGNLETHLLEYFLYAVDEVNCTTCPIFTDYGQLLDDINANSWLKAAVRNSDKPTRNSIFKAWEILSKSGSDFAGAGLANSETLVKALAKDLRDSEALRTFLSTAPDSGVDLAQFSRRVRAWEALASSSPELRRSVDNLELIESFSDRFHYSVSSEWDAFRSLFDEVPIDKHDELVELLHRAEKDFDNNNLWSVRAEIDAGGHLFLEIEGGITYTPLAKPIVGDLSIQSLDVNQFETVVSDLTFPHLDPNKPGVRMLLGNDNSVSWGQYYPTQPGVLDVHVHGDFLHPNLVNVPDLPSGLGEHVIVAVQDGVLIIMTPSQVADIIRSHPSFDQINAVRLFNCNGIAGGQEIADRISKPVITSTDFISVNSSGQMWTENGTMVKLINE